MKILSYLKAEKMDGSTYHRIFLPHQYSRHEVKQAYQLNDELLQWCDILVYSRHSAMDAAFLRSKATEFGFKIVVDTDDGLECPPGHPKYDFWRTSGVSLQVRNHLASADAVTVTHKRLATEIGSFCNNVHIVPPALPFGEGQFAVRKKRNEERLRLLYPASVVNYKNTSLIASAMRKLKHAPIEIIITGYCEGGLYDIIIENLTNDGAIPYRTIQWTGVDDYMKGYEGDVMILPSNNTHFNSMKSNLKILEAGAAGMPIIVSESDPYLGFGHYPGVKYARGEKDWVREISRYIDDRSKPVTDGISLTRDCSMFNDVRNSNRDDVYESLMK